MKIIALRTQVIRSQWSNDGSSIERYGRMYSYEMMEAYESKATFWLGFVYWKRGSIDGFSYTCM